MSQAQQSIAYSDSIAYGSERIAFSVEYRERKTMAITVHPNHSTSFFQMLDAVLPDWRMRKARLEQAEI
jgi:hypothetical protein